MTAESTETVSNLRLFRYPLVQGCKQVLRAQPDKPLPRFAREVGSLHAPGSLVPHRHAGGQKRQVSDGARVVEGAGDVVGDLNNTRDLMQAVPKIVGPDGHVYVIVSGRTFSAGISSVGYLKQAGGERVTVVGSPIGDPLEFWAEGSPVRLPQSGALNGVATERHNYMTGCQESDCHGSICRNPIRVDSLEPDIQPEVTYADVVGGAEPYLEVALELARGEE